MDKEKAITGTILGTAVGDALGLHCEGLSRQRLKKMFKNQGYYHFFFNKGMVSDDTEHTCMLAQAIISSGGDPEKFGKKFAWQLRLWLLGLPAGIGLATLRAIIKLWLGFSAEKSGVYSAGNGPAMRSSLIGVCFGDNNELMKKYLRISTRITHTDPKAEYASMAVAIAAYLNSKKEFNARNYLEELKKEISSKEFIQLIEKVIISVEAGEDSPKFAEAMGLHKGISGYIYHTVPVVIHACLRNPDNYQMAVSEIISCGGDTDTTAAILGGIIGAGTGKEGIPEHLLDNLIEWPRSVSWMENLAKQLNQSLDNPEKHIRVKVFAPAIIIRNLFFLIIVLLHGFRRILPPY